MKQLRIMIALVGTLPGVLPGMTGAAQAEAGQPAEGAPAAKPGERRL